MKPLKAIFGRPNVPGMKGAKTAKKFPTNIQQATGARFWNGK